MLQPETILQNRYRIVGQLAKGGMGTVYEAIDLRFDSQVALKETHFTEEALRKQFEREARLLYKLRHPAIARVIDHFMEEGGQFLVMDFIAGQDLSELLQISGEPLSIIEVSLWADQLLLALSYLHSHEPPVIHRDIKPTNIKLSDTGQIMLLDFGLAKGFVGQLTRVTPSGSIFGYTPHYAPLEQIQGSGTDPRSDLYSLAATLYNLLTGIVPPDALSRATAIVNEEADPLLPANEVNAKVPKAVADILKKAMAQNANRRFSNAYEMRAALNQATRTLTSTTFAEDILSPAKSDYSESETTVVRQFEPNQTTILAGRTESPTLTISQPVTANQPTISQANLSQLLLNSGRRQFWIKPWGHPDFSPEEGEQVFNDPTYRIGFAKNPGSVKVGDILIVYRIKVSKLMFIAEVVASPFHVTKEEIEKYAHFNRWQWNIETRNLTPDFGTQWAKHSLRPFALAKEYNEQHPQDKVKLGSLQFGNDKVRVSEGFAKFLIKEILRVMEN